MPSAQSQQSEMVAHCLPQFGDMVHELETHPNLDEQVAIMEHHLELLQSGIEQLQRVLHLEG